METSELIKRVRKIEIKTKGLSKHLFTGEYHSAFKGRGMSFSEVRDYQFGDDVRNIDWNVTARYNTPFVKVFEEERELTVMLIVDISQSAFFGSVRQFKNQVITEIAAVIAFSANNNNDKVGLILFSDKVEKYIAPKKGRSHILRIIRELVNFEPTGKATDLSTALQFFNNIQKKRSVTFILSDFMTSGYDDGLKIASRRHDIIGLHLYDPREIELPKNIGLILAQDAETGKTRWIDTGSKKERKRYKEYFYQNQAKFQNTFLKSGSDTLSIAIPEKEELEKNDQFYVKDLLRFFKKRHH
ncbi:MAG: DUF58 domain-containing protein [Saprospiraceae bacterium]